MKRNALLEEKAAAEKAAAEKAAAELHTVLNKKNSVRLQKHLLILTCKHKCKLLLKHLHAEGAQPQATVATPAAAPAVQTQTVATPAATSRPTYSSSASSYPVGECTWGAKVLAPWAGDYWGNGAQWATSAAAAGFRTGSTPQVGAIACWNDGGYGHVAVVTAVESTTRIQVSESNYAGNRTLGNHRGWFNPTTTSSGFVTYIYAD